MADAVPTETQKKRREIISPTMLKRAINLYKYSREKDEMKKQEIRNQLGDMSDDEVEDYIEAYDAGVKFDEAIKRGNKIAAEAIHAPKRVNAIKGLLAGGALANEIDATLKIMDDMGIADKIPTPGTTEVKAK